MRKILYTYENNMPTVALIQKSAEIFAEKNDTQYRFKQLQEITREDLAWCDVIELIRPNDPYSVHLAKLAQEAGKFVISYFDDDLYNLPASVPNPFWRKNSIRKALALTNVVESSSRYIGEKYQGFTLENRFAVGDTVVDSQDMKSIPELIAPVQDGKTVNLIYAANPGHVVFFNQYILPIMPRLCQRYAGKISMTFMGVRPDLAEYESQISIAYYPTMPLEEYRQKIKEGDFHIGLSPLPSDEFTKCKYFNKFIEYTIAGIVGVYSNTEPYTYVVNHGENGFLAENDSEDWFKCLCDVIDDAVLRNRCICGAQNLLQTEFNHERVTARIREAVPEKYNYHAEIKPIGSLQPYKAFHRGVLLLDRVYQVLFYLKSIGISGVINKIKVHFRESKAYSNKNGGSK